MNRDFRSREQILDTEVRSEVFSLSVVVTATFRVLSLFVVTKCYSDNKIESVIINCSSAWLTSNKSTHRSKPAAKVTNTRDNIYECVYTYICRYECENIYMHEYMCTCMYVCIDV
jgi:hypothetical protein